MTKHSGTGRRLYEPPRLTVVGTLHELTLVDPCNKDLGGSDGFTFQQQPVVCTSR